MHVDRNCTMLYCNKSNSLDDCLESTLFEVTSKLTDDLF